MREVQSHNSVVEPQPQQRSRDGAADILVKRLGASHQRYRKIEELPVNALAFYSKAGKNL